MSEYTDALQPIASSSNSSTTTRILKELAPQLLHPRILNSSAFIQISSGASPSSSSSSSTPYASSVLSLYSTNNAFLSLARGINVRTSKISGKGKGSTSTTSTDLRILEGVQRLLDLPIPALPTVIEEDEDSRLLTNTLDPSTSSLGVGLFEGFNATIPSAQLRKTARRRRRAGISERQLGIQAGVNELGLKERGERARGLLTDFVVESIEATPRRRTIKGKRRSSFLPTAAASNGLDTEGEQTETLTRPELESEAKEIGLDKVALQVRRKLVLKDLEELEERIRKLEIIRVEMGNKLLQLKEEELELDDELEGVSDRILALDARSSGRAVSSTSSRRRRGPAFLPSEHDDLPPNIAFMTLSSPNSISPISALDFSEPYGTLVTSSSEPDKGVRVWDLSNGEEIAALKGHKGLVKCLLVEGTVCVTGGQDGKIVLWDLPAAVEMGLEQGRNLREDGYPHRRLQEETKEDVFFTSGSESPANGLLDGPDDGSDGAATPNDGFSKARLKILEGHSKDVTCLSYEDTSLVSGSSDKTLRLWDLNTGQCVVTMDILWAISNPLPAEVDEPESMHISGMTAMSASVPSLPTSSTLSASPGSLDGDYPWHSSSAFLTPNRKRSSLSGLRRLSSRYGTLSSLAETLNSPSTPTAQISSFNFAQPTPPFSDGSWEMYSDFVGGLQLWSYALASGSADGCVRMWDTRTGQSVRGLIGHTGAVTCLQFDSFHLVSGSLDKSVRLWDLRTGRTIDTLRYDGPVTDLQFDSRRILVAGGTNAVQVFNRTTLQQTELVVNGHTSPVERLRFMDRYLATGGRDATVKIWSLA